LLLGSKKNSLFTAVSPFKWIARHIRKGKPFDYSTLILQSTAFARNMNSNMIRVILPFHRLHSPRSSIDRQVWQFLPQSRNISQL